MLTGPARKNGTAGSDRLLHSGASCIIRRSGSVPYVTVLRERTKVQQAEARFDVDSLTGRQVDVLDAVLRLLVEGGGALTMEAVARRASCSRRILPCGTGPSA